MTKDPVHDLYDRLNTPDAVKRYTYFECRLMVDIARSLVDERAAWRQYACAALCIATGEDRLDAMYAGKLADHMMRLERERFEGKT